MAVTSSSPALWSAWLSSAGLASLPAFVLGALVAAALVTLWHRAQWHLSTRRLRHDVLRQSRATLKGQVVEQLVPLLPAFPFDAQDARFLGAPVDYIVFDGYSDGEDVEVIFVEVKTGGARLSPGEKRIRDAVRQGRVRFQTLRVGD